MESKTGQLGGKNDNTLINRIMLKFRPIAPKPVPQGSDAAEVVPYKRTKRKYVRVKKNSSCKSNNEEAKGELVMFEGESSPGGSNGIESSTMWSLTPEQPPPPISINYPNYKSSAAAEEHGTTSSRRVVESWLVVDGMTVTFLSHSMDIGVLGRSDTENLRNLEVDTCPVLISDAEHRVQFMNLAYKNMVVYGGGGDDEVEEKGEAPVDVAAWLVLKERIPERWPVFTCRVRVVYTCREEQHSLTMPCDVWRMDFGGYAWRLDAKAALKLGR